MFKLRGTLFATLVVGAVAVPAAAQCIGAMAELDLPPVVGNLSPTDPGFVARYWAWDDLNNRRGGQARPELVDLGFATLLADLNWARADVCLTPGVVTRTAVLLEALGPDGFGRWALVNLGADPSGWVDVDRAQRRLGQVWSVAAPVPSPTIDDVTVTAEALEVELRWQLDRRAEALSDLTGPLGAPLPSVRGTAVYIINGPRPTARPWDWSFADDLQADAVNGFSTDTSATVRLTRSIWEGQSVAFALALTFDGDGDAEGERPESRSVHGEYLGRPSRWLALPPAGVDLPVAIVAPRMIVLHRSQVVVDFDAQAEPAGVSYRIWIRLLNGSRRPLTKFVGGLHSYHLNLALPPWCRMTLWNLDIEMIDSHGRVVATAVAARRI